MLNKIRGKPGYEVTITGNDLVQKDPSGNLLTGIHFFYGCGKEEKQIIEVAGTKRKLPVYGFVKFFGKESMENYGVQF